MSTKLVHNVETGEILEVELSAADIARHEKDIADKKAEELKASNKDEAKTALLERLGITADEAALLLG
jgi:hypothetical protein